MEIIIGQKCESSEIGIINEIGDLGLGFDPISEDDQKTIEEHMN